MLQIAVVLAAVLVASALAGGVAFLLQRLGRAAYRERGERIQKALGAPRATAQGLGHGEATTLAGRLVLAPEGSSVATYHPDTAALLEAGHGFGHAVNEGRAARAALDLDGVEVSLEGPILVLFGTDEARAQAGRVGVTGVRAGPDERGVVRSLRDGDEVIARGRLVVEAAAEGVSFRVPAAAISLGPEHERGSLVLAASAAPRVPAAVRARAGRAGIVAFVLVALGALPLTARRSPPPASSPSPSPVARADTCGAEVDALVDRGDLRRAEDRAERCAAPRSRGRERFLAGDFTAASDAFAASSEVPTVSAIQAHAFAHRFDRAAIATRALRDDLYRTEVSREHAAMSCIADRFAVLGSDDGARRRLAGAPHVRSRSCRLLALDVVGVSSHAGGSECHEAPWEPTVVVSHAPFHLVPGDEAFAPNYDAVQALRDPWSHLRFRPVALDRRLADHLRRSGLEPSGDTGSGRAYTLERRYWSLASLVSRHALFEATMGRADEALAALALFDRLITRSRRVHAPAEDVGSYGDRERGLLRESFVYAAAAAYHAGAFDEARRQVRSAGEEVHAVRLLEQGIALRTTRGPVEFPLSDAPWPPDGPLFLAASGGDGAEVVRVLREQRATGRTVLARVAPHLARGRDQLGAWVANDFVPPCVDCGAFTVAAWISDRRSAAEVLGEGALVAEYRRVEGRFHDALTDPEVAMAITFLEQLRSEGRLPCED